MNNDNQIVFDGENGNLREAFTAVVQRLTKLEKEVEELKKKLKESTGLA